MPGRAVSIRPPASLCIRPYGMLNAGNRALLQPDTQPEEKIDTGFSGKVSGKGSS